MKVKPQISLYMILLIVFVCIVVLIPLFKPGFIITDDGNWMIIRLSAFYQSFREGQFPVRFLGRLNYSYGYPVANFLYPGFLYLGSLLHAIGFSFIDSIKIIMGGSVVLGALSVYFWLKRHVSPLASTIGSIGFVLSPYLLFDIYKRGSVGEVLAIGLSALSLYLVDSKRFFWLSPVLAFLLISHNSVALLTFIFIGVIVFFQKDYKGLLAWILALGMATFFWFPALYEKKLVNFDNTNISDPSQYFITFKSINMIGLLNFIAFIWLLIIKPKKINPFYFIGFIVLTTLSLWISSPIWNNEALSKIFQFPFRMLSLNLILGAYLVAVMIDKYTNDVKKILIFICIVFMLQQAIGYVKNIKYSFDNDGYYSTNEATTTVANEYMPKWVSKSPTERPTVRMAFQTGRGVIDFKKSTSQKIEANVTSHEDGIMQINSIYYPGWGVLINDLPAKISYDNVNGLIRFEVPKGNHHIVAEFRETIERFVSNIFSLLFIITWLFYFMISSLKNHKIFIKKVKK